MAPSPPDFVASTSFLIVSSLEPVSFCQDDAVTGPWRALRWDRKNCGSGLPWDWRKGSEWVQEAVQHWKLFFRKFWRSLLLCECFIHSPKERLSIHTVQILGSCQVSETLHSSYLVGNVNQWFEYISFELTQTAYYSLDILNIQLLYCNLTQMKNSDYPSLPQHLV